MNIEEAKGYGLIPLIESIPFSLEDSEWELVESDNGDIIAGASVLGYVRGPFFVVEGKSDNNRWYSKELWDKVINETKDAHNEGRIVGTIGHDLELDDKALREGKGSHRVTKLWIPNNESKTKQMGMGEAAILDTTTGRELYGYLKGGVRLDVSSRAFGKFEGKKDGADIVEASTYKYEGFDFVRTGGVKGATPKLVVNKQSNENFEKAKVIKRPDSNVDIQYIEKSVKESKKENKNMSDDMKQILESVTNEKVKLQDQLDSVLANNEDLKGKIAISENRLSEISQILDEYKSIGKISELKDISSKFSNLVSKNESTEKELVEIKAKIEESDKLVKEYESLGTFEEIDSALDLAKKMSEELKDVGTVEEFKNVKEELKTYEELGTIDELSKIFAILEGYSELGSVEEIKEAFEKTKVFVDSVNEFGSLENIDKVMDAMDEYTELGTPEEISKAFDMISGVMENMKKERFESDVKEVRDSLKIKETTARTLLEKMSKDDALTLANTIKSDLGLEIAEQYKVKEVDESLNEEADDSVNLKPSFSRDRATRLVESMGR